MATVDSTHPYPSADKYWDLVKRTLDEVFQHSTKPAEHLRWAMSDWPPEEQLLLYHAEPLNVAADLAGRRPSDAEIKAYRHLADQVGWGVP